MNRECEVRGSTTYNPLCEEKTHIVLPLRYCIRLRHGPMKESRHTSYSLRLFVTAKKPEVKEKVFSTPGCGSIVARARGRSLPRPTHPSTTTHEHL